MAFSSPANVPQQQPLTPDFIGEHSSAAPPLHRITNPFDVVIRIAAKPRRQVWTAETSILKGRMTRIGGRAMGSASAHTLLAMAVISATRVIKGQRLKQIQQRIGNNKPTIEIITEDQTFADGLKKFMVREKHGDWRVGRNFWREFSRELNRFQVTVTTSQPQDVRTGILATWATQNVIVPDEANNVPAVFVPVTVSETI